MDVNTENWAPLTRMHWFALCDLRPTDTDSNRLHDFAVSGFNFTNDDLSGSLFVHTRAIGAKPIVDPGVKTFRLKARGDIQSIGVSAGAPGRGGTDVC